MSGTQVRTLADLKEVAAAVVAEAADVIADGKARMREFGVADETAWQVGLSCGGRIKVYVEPVGA